MLIMKAIKYGRRRHQSHHLIHEVEEIVGEKGNLLPALLALVMGDHTAQVNVQEGGFELEIPPDQIPQIIIQISHQILFHGQNLKRGALDPTNASPQFHPLIHWCSCVVCPLLYLAVADDKGSKAMMWTYLRKGKKEKLILGACLEANRCQHVHQRKGPV